MNKLCLNLGLVNTIRKSKLYVKKDLPFKTYYFSKL